MTAMERDGWHEANRLHLRAAIEGVRAALEAQLGGESIPCRPPPAMPPGVGPAALEQLQAAFALSSFERDLLVLCAGVELDPRVGALCAAACDHGHGRAPTFALALATLPGAEWDALAPTAALRHWQLVTVGEGETLSGSPLRLSERVLCFLLGIDAPDERLAELVEPVSAPRSLPASYRPHAERIVALWDDRDGGWPLIEIDGDARGDKEAVAAAACAALGVRLHRLRAAAIPAGAADRDLLARLWQREAVLGRGALLVTLDDEDAAATAEAAAAFVERAGGLICVDGPLPQRPTGPAPARLRLDRPPASEQRALWQSALGPLAVGLNGQLDALVSQFPLDATGIETAGRRVRQAAPAAEAVVPLLWDACRTRHRSSLDRLAQRIEPAARWDELVLPEEPRRTLAEIAIHVRQRATVYERWGFAARGGRGLGIGALFAGPSGTGKTMAAEILAGELRLDLYRVDLSQLVSKYIGDTEKNLRAIFDAAEESGTVLLFDEADALFGKRSEVKDSHDRYANIEVSYLLQRMEAYRGLAILTTNQRAALDPAFLRRLRFVIGFPFPDAPHRARIWERIFPPQTPTEGLDPGRLAQLNVAGGNIRTIALNAAFLAADAGESVGMRHILRAARAEYAKLEKPLTAAEIGGWT